MNKEFMLELLNIRLDRLREDKRTILYETSCSCRVTRSKINKEIGIINLFIYLLGLIKNHFVVEDDELITSFMRLVEPRRR